jgi:hypothetical protein
MSQDADNLYIARTKAVAGCFSMFLLMFGLTFTPLFFPASQDLLAKGLLFPLLFALEFVVLVPLYYFFFRKRGGWAKAFSTPGGLPFCSRRCCLFSLSCH